MVGGWTHPLMSTGTFNEATAIEVSRRAMAGYHANLDPDWKPSAEDMAWQEELVRKMAERGKWEVPSADSSIWQVFKRDKLAILEEGDPEHSLNKQIAMVFIAMGWNVGFGEQIKESE